MKTLALAAAAAAIALGSSFAGTTSAEAGYYHKRIVYKHYVYTPKIFVKKVWKPAIVYKPAVVYKPVKIYKPVHVYHKVW